jgi:hypothetical protein
MDVQVRARATISYLLSEQGRRDSLRRGGNGKRSQTVAGLVPPQDLDVFPVSDDGQVFLDASRAREEYSSPKCSSSSLGQKRTGWCTVEWNVVPEWSDLLAFARWADAAEKKYWHHFWCVEEEISIAFLADPAARADLIEQDRVIIKGVSFPWDDPVSVEAHQRVARDRAKLEQDIRSWITDNGTDNQRQRMIAGLLPLKEAQTTIEESLFAPLRDFQLYQRFDPLTVCVCQFDALAFDAPATCKVQFQSVDACGLNADEWESYSAIMKAVHSAQFQLREHRAKCASRTEVLIKRGVIVKLSVGSVVFKREYAL